MRSFGNEESEHLWGKHPHTTFQSFELAFGLVEDVLKALEGEALFSENESSEAREDWGEEGDAVERCSVVWIPGNLAESEVEGAYAW